MRGRRGERQLALLVGRGEVVSVADQHSRMPFCEPFSLTQTLRNIASKHRGDTCKHQKENPIFIIMPFHLSVTKTSVVLAKDNGGESSWRSWRQHRFGSGRHAGDGTDRTPRAPDG